MKFLFLNLSGLKFTVMTPEEEPLGGSESCVCYLARTLAQKGHDVTLLAHLPENTSDRIAGIRHCPASFVQKKDFFISEKFDAIVIVNAPVAAPIVKEFIPTSRLYLWNHVLPDQPAMKELPNPAVLDALDAIIYVSAWQKEQTETYAKINKRSAVIGNGLTPSFEAMFASPAEVKTSKENRAAYTATPFRGLKPLLKIMEASETKTYLDIYSSMRVYQAPDASFAPLYKEAKTNPWVSLHGSLSQRKLAEALQPAAFFLYPCIYPETFCIGALEALAAGMDIIAPHVGALPTTTQGYADLLPINPETSEGIQAFREALDKKVRLFQSDPDAWSERQFEQLQQINRTSSWKKRAESWEQLLAGSS